VRLAFQAVPFRGDRFDAGDGGPELLALSASAHLDSGRAARSGLPRACLLGVYGSGIFLAWARGWRRIRDEFLCRARSTPR